MSLDVYLLQPGLQKTGSGIFIREDGATKEISREEWDRRYPGKEPCIANYEYDNGEVYSRNITHNLGHMAREAGIYEPLWRPDEIGITKAQQLIEPLTKGLEWLKRDPDRFKAFNPSNSWGTYEGLVDFVECYLDACKEYPEADVYAWR